MYFKPEINNSPKYTKDIITEMTKIIKSNTYIPVNDSLFNMPLPCSFEIMDENRVIFQVRIDAGKNVNTKNFTAPCNSNNAGFTFTDIHYFFKSRVDLTYSGMFRPISEKENDTYQIIRNTHGILSIDKIWIRFEGENLTYEQVTNKNSIDNMGKIEEILNQHSVDLNRILNEKGADNG